MKRLFAKREPNLLTSLIVEYISSVIPTGIMCRETIGDTDVKSIMVFSNSKGLTYEFSIVDNYDVKELSSTDKQHLNETVVIPALKELDEEIRIVHLAIKKRLEELESN